MKSWMAWKDKCFGLGGERYPTFEQPRPSVVFGHSFHPPQKKWSCHRLLTPFSRDLRGIPGGGGVLGCPWPPLGRPSFEQTKTPWQYLGRKSHCWEAHFFKIFFFVKYFRQRLLSLVNMGLHAAIIRHDNLVSSLCDPPFEKSWLRPWTWLCWSTF